MAPQPEIVIAYWNANGVSNKKIELEHFLKEKNIDVMIIVETFLKPGQRFNVNNYSCCRLDRLVSTKGGILILIKRNIKYDFMSSFKLEVVEALGIQLRTSNGLLSIVGAYHPGSNKTISKFRSDIKRLTKIRNNFIICGDLNARHRMWNCASTNSAGKSLFEELQKGQFFIFYPDTPTHYPADSTRNASTIDLTITKINHNLSDLKTSTDFTSDHLPVTFSVLKQKPELAPSRLMYD